LHPVQAPAERRTGRPAGAHFPGAAAPAYGDDSDVRKRTMTAAAAVHGHSAVHHVVAAALTSGYDRAFGISAVALVAGALIALLLPARLGTAQAPIPVPERSRPAKAPAEA